MRAFADLLDGLTFQPARSAKLRLLADYLDRTPDPDRGWALAAFTGALSFRSAKPALLRDLVLSRVDPTLFGWSYDYVGDLAETIALIWPAAPAAGPCPSLDDVVRGLSAGAKGDLARLLEGWLDACRPEERHALLKLVTGGLRVGVSARLAKQALADRTGGAIEIGEIEEVWHGLAPPYTELFAWLEGRGARPSVAEGAVFRPLMLANPLEDEDLASLDPAAYLAEWKWDGIRVQVAARGAARALFSRTGDDVSAAFPDLIAALDGGVAPFDAVADGELLVVRDGVVAPFNDLQQRLNRKVLTPKLLAEYPAHMRLYDLLFEGDEDLRALPFAVRRARLAAWHGRTRPPRSDLSDLVPFESWEALAAIRAGAREAGIEGLMLKRADSPYLAGRPKGPWFKWKRGALTLDCVMMYAQRGHGKRSSFYSDYTFGAWRTDADGAEALVPVGKAYSGFTDEELRLLDKWVRDHTVKRYGPVREVEPGLVLEVAFDSVHRSSRHRSGVAMRFPRIARIRWDKPAGEADRLESLERLVT